MRAVDKAFSFIMASKLRYSEGQWKRIKIFLVGDAEAGKTSTLKWLQGLKIDAAHVITDSMEVTTVEMREWKEISVDMKEYMADALCSTHLSPHSTESQSPVLTDAQPSTTPKL